MTLGKSCNFTGVAAILPCFGKSLWALGCAECYLTSAALSGSAGHSLDIGILALGLPPLAMFLAILFYLRSRNPLGTPSPENKLHRPMKWGFRSSVKTFPPADGREALHTQAG